MFSTGCIILTLPPGSSGFASLTVPALRSSAKCFTSFCCFSTFFDFTCNGSLEFRSRVGFAIRSHSLLRHAGSSLSGAVVSSLTFSGFRDPFTGLPFSSHLFCRSLDLVFWASARSFLGNTLTDLLTCFWVNTFTPWC